MLPRIRSFAKLVLIFAIVSVTPPTANSQAPVPSAAETPPAASATTNPVAFDVVSIHPSKVENVVKGEIEYQVSIFRTMDDGFSAENVPIVALIADAYHVKPDAITGGPDWVRSDSYNVSGKITSSDGIPPPKLTATQHRQLLQALLADRVKLTLHPETKEANVYNLTLAPGGSKLHPLAPPDPSASAKPLSGYPAWVAAGQVKGESVALTSFSEFFSHELHHPVLDKTGLTGKYDFTLKWAPDNTPADAPEASGPTIFTAVQEQLGLKLVPAKGSIKTLAIDHIEKPSEN